MRWQGPAFQYWQRTMRIWQILIRIFPTVLFRTALPTSNNQGVVGCLRGLNVLRAQMMAKYGLDEMEFSQNYCFFYDQLEKANLFLQGIIDTREKPMEDKMVEWLFKHPISDGGQFTGISDIIGKYGVVPASVMPENL